MIDEASEVLDEDCFTTQRITFKYGRQRLPQQRDNADCVESGNAIQSEGHESD